MSDRTMLEPTPELPDDTLISDIEFPTRIRNVLATDGLETVAHLRRGVYAVPATAVGECDA
jgi:hypothetical protein